MKTLFPQRRVNPQDQEAFKNWYEAHSPDSFMRAVVMNFHNMSDNGKKPGAGHWEHHSKGRGELQQMVIAEWCKVTELDDWLFPWNLDDIISTHVGYRKCSEQKKKDIRSQMGMNW